MYRRRPNPLRILMLKCLLGCFLALLLILVIDSRVRPTIETMSGYQAKIFAMKTINNAINDELVESNLKYNDIVEITKAEDGVVSSVEIDMVALNKFKAAVTNRIAANLRHMENSSIYIPIGSLLNSQFFSGRGPDVVFKIMPSGFVDANLEHQFSMAGINQTLHRIMLKVTVEISAIIPGYRVKTVVNTNFCIAETVIVGAVPDAFTDVKDDESNLPGKIFDYGAEIQQYK